MDILSRYRPQILSLLRIMAGLLVLQHGTAKILGFPASDMADTPIGSLGGIAGLIELVCGASSSSASRPASPPFSSAA
jgi:putative oxidoreductase